MSGKRDIGKTIGEVEKITGIPKRTLKYFIEQKLIQPSRKSESGYWLYSEEDVRRAQLAALCRELEFPNRTIRSILADPSKRWPEELERQVTRLAERQRRAGARLSRAESLLASWEGEPWASLITNPVPTAK